MTLRLAFALCLVGCAAHPEADDKGDAAAKAPPDAQAALDAASDGSDASDAGPNLITSVGAPTVLVEAGLPAATRVFDEAKGLLADVHETTYTHDTLIDEGKGTFDLDCSGFLDFVLQQVDPPAFMALASATTSRPYAFDYVDFITGLPSGGQTGWHAVADAMSLVPGDIISWLEPAVLDSVDTGHVMIVAAAPAMSGSGASLEADILVIDAASTGHGLTDQRTVTMTGGLGEGTIALTIDSAGAPTGYRWSTEASSLAFSTTVGLAHLE